MFKSRHLNHEEPKLNTQVFDLGSFVMFKSYTGKILSIKNCDR